MCPIRKHIFKTSCPQDIGIEILCGCDLGILHENHCTISHWLVTELNMPNETYVLCAFLFLR